MTSTEARPPVGIRSLFDAAFEHLEGMVQFIAGGDAEGWSHGQMEAWVSEEGRELQRRFLQAMFDTRTENEPRHSVVVGGDGIERTHRRERRRNLGTVVGDVGVLRVAYSAPEEGSVVPLDESLSMPRGLYSDGVKREAALEIVRGSFEDAQRAIKRHTGVEVPKRQLLGLVRDAATDFEAFYMAQRASSEEPSSSKLLVLSCDGKGVVMRPEGLRKETQKAAETTSRKLKGRLSKGEKNGRKRMATVASVYSIAPFARSPEEVMDPEVEMPAGRPEPANKRVWARLDASMEQVIADLFDEAEKRDPERKRTWVVLVDGANHQLKLIRREARRRGVEIVVIVDFIHVLEYLWKAAWDFFSEGDAAAESWVLERALEILRGRAPFVAAGIRRSATLRELDKRKNADACADYLLNKKKYLRYDEALAGGMPIATGVIEGACRHIVKDRMDITGARWGLDGGEAVLRLRSLWSSGDFDAYWKFHLRRCHDRIYGEDYIRAAA